MTRTILLHSDVVRGKTDALSPGTGLHRQKLKWNEIYMYVYH